MAGVNVFWVAQYSNKQWGYHYHKHTFYQMVCPLSGSILVNEQSIVGPGQVMLTKPDQYHNFPPVDPDEGMMSLFDCKFTITNPELHTALMATPHCFTLTSGALVSNLIQSILAEAKTKAPFYQENIDNLFSSILISIVRQFSGADPAPVTQAQDPASSWSAEASAPFGANAEHLAAYIDANIQRITSLDDLSVYLHVNRTSVTELFKRTFGLPPMRYVLHRRLALAKKLLSQNDYTISEISEMVGFGSIYYFSKIFKEREGLSPMSYREQQQDFYIPLPHSTEIADETTYV